MDPEARGIVTVRNDLSIGQRRIGEQSMIGTVARDSEPRQIQIDSTFEVHYSIGDLAKQWRLGRETVRLLVKNEPGVLKIRMGHRRV
jgi:hypothetical protein